jgi:hypothetical protein
LGNPSIRKVSDMTYPLEAPNGWFLYKAQHQHTEVRYTTDFHEPLPHAEGPWIVQFQKYPKGGMLTEGRGRSLEEAWKNASEAVRGGTKIKGDSSHEA